MKELLATYARYQVAGIGQRAIKHSTIEPLIAQLPAMYSVKPVGQSAEQRAIYGIEAGSGPTRILLWSQMHGDESTATRALFDVFRFLSANDAFNDLRRQLLEQLHLLFIPMLNPDGAERFQRENAWHIDLNRDAVKVTTPEAKILRDQTLAFKPSFSFNLHDQESYYSAGVSRTPASIAFLAPPPDADESITESRRRAMQLIVLLNQQLQPAIPGGVAKWSDSYEPRAFGEWSQAQQSATILVESGGYYNDPEREYIRQLNFAILLKALHTIATDTYHAVSIDPYFAIPYNRENGMFDRIEREKTVTCNGATFITDVGYRKDETVFGDLETYGSLEK